MGTLSNIYELNGVIDTNRSVLDNMNTICNAAGCWMTYDITTGLWSVVINKPGTSIKSFTDNNIIGNLNVSGTGISEAYNRVSVEFPHKDLRDSIDYADMSIPEADRYSNELDNTLNISLQCINNPVQAQYIGIVELKQSRVDRVVEFRTDYRALGLKAGQLIDITSEMYGWTNKVFRITKLTESDNDDGNIELQITGLEYDANVYTDDGIIFEERTKKTGIVPKSQNAVLTADDALANANNLTLALSSGDVALINSLREELTNKMGIPSIIAAGETPFTSVPGDLTEHFFTIKAGLILPSDGLYKIRYNINWGGSGVPPVDGVTKISEMYAYLDSALLPLSGSAATGQGNVPLYEDHILEALFTGTKNGSLEIRLGLLTDYATAGYFLNWEVLMIPAQTN